MRESQRAVRAESLVAQLLRDNGWSLDAEHSLGEFRPDLIARRGSHRYAVEIKAAAEGRTTGLTEILGQRQPGGSTPTVSIRIDPADMRIAVTSQLRPHVARRAGYGSTPARARGLALAAIRETFEETGILIGERAKCPLSVAEIAEQGRRRALPWAEVTAPADLPANPQLRAAYGIGFCVLFTQVAMFTYVTFHLAAPGNVGLGIVE